MKKFFYRTFIHEGSSLKKMVDVQQLKYVGSNFISNLLLLGRRRRLAVHYEQLSTVYDAVPLIMAYGHLKIEKRS